MPCDSVYELAGFSPWPEGTIEVLPVGLEVVPDSLGFFHLHGLCAGLYRVRVRLGAHVVAETTVVVPMEAPLLLEGPGQAHAVVIRDWLVRRLTIDSVAWLVQPEGGLSGWLVRVPGVSLSQAGPLLQKPILEGLRGTRIAYWQGGQPLASQQWGEEHAPEIDPFSTEEVTLSIGPSPIQYGPEAVGGAILLPLPNLCCRAPLEGRFLVVGIANGQGGLAAGRLQGTLRSWGYRLQGSLYRLGTLQAPKYFLTGSGTQQAHASLTIERLFARWHVRGFYAQYNAQIGLFQGMQVGNLSDLQRSLEAPLPPVSSQFSYALTPPYQQVTHELATLQLSHLLPNEALLSLTYGRQYDRRQERDAVGIYALQGLSLDLQLTTHYAQLTYEHRGWTVAGTFQGQRNYIQYAYFIPAYRRYQGGAYFLYKRGPWQMGARAEMCSYDFLGELRLQDGTLASPRRQPFPAGGAELSYAGRRWYGQAAFVLRPPNPAELYAYGYHQAQAAFEIGANALRAEPVFSLRGRYSTSALQLGLSAYYSPAFIWKRLGPPMLSLRGASLTVQYEQTPAAWMSLSGLYVVPMPLPLRKWGLHGEMRGHFLWGTLWSPRPAPLPLLPGPLLSYTLQWTQSSWHAEITLHRYFQQTRYTLEAEYRPPPPGYLLLEAHLRYRWKAWQFALSGQNLLNHSYRAYPDLMRFFADQVGRQVRLAVEYHFSVGGQRSTP